MRIPPASALLPALCLLTMNVLSAAPLESSQFYFTTSQRQWQQGVVEEGSGEKGRVLDLRAAQPLQRIEGFGGCFNEKGWEVLGLLTAAGRTEVLDRLFTPGKGCGFTLGRMPMGANDYSLEWYSYAETPDDYRLEHFSIERDRTLLLPYIKEGLSRNGELRIWASPWCPPAWMKVNRHYAGMPAPVNDLPPERAGREMQTQFRMEPQVLSSYADYFVKFIEAYRKEGVAVSSVHVQNEPNSCQNFPSCVWRPEDLALFIGEYLGPRFEKAGVTASIWLGTVERPHLERVETILESTAGRYIRGVGLQWAGRGLVEELHRRRPQLPLMQTETECGNGSNDWAAAEHTWDQMQHYFRNGAGAYMYWNMVLDETGNSRWGWRQNAMITVDRTSRTVRYNPEFFLMRHFSQWIKRGAHFLTVPGIGGQVLAFRNPDGKHVLVMANLTQHPLSYSVRLPSRSAQLTLPPGSFSTFVE